tara:strand:- start:3359 stop:4066 length:708 start_codon:yes stop_codon:yes gene_type:complete
MLNINVDKIVLIVISLLIVSIIYNCFANKNSNNNDDDEDTDNDHTDYNDNHNINSCNISNEEDFENNVDDIEEFEHNVENNVENKVENKEDNVENNVENKENTNPIKAYEDSEFNIENFVDEKNNKLNSQQLREQTIMTANSKLCNNNLNTCDLLPKDTKEEWFESFDNFDDVCEGNNFIDNGVDKIGISTIASSLRNANLDIRPAPEVPRYNTGPFNQSTITHNYQLNPLCDGL